MTPFIITSSLPGGGGGGAWSAGSFGGRVGRDLRDLATPRLIRDAHDREMEIHIWTLNRADTILDAIQRGADGVITDDPALAVRIREELAELTALKRILLLFRDLMPEAELATKTNGEM